MKAAYGWARTLLGRHTPVDTGPVIAVLKFHGVLRLPRSQLPARGGETSLCLERQRKDIDAAFDLKNARAVALDVNCPGGAPAQCEALAAYIRARAAETQLPVYAFAQDVAASGGYWLMCAGDELYACAGSLVGSIGVQGSSFGAVELMQRLGVERRVATAGQHKGEGDPFQPRTEDQIARQQALMDSLHSTFVDFVKQRRSTALQRASNATASDASKSHGGTHENAQSELFSGRVWTGADAAGNGLVDGIGDLHTVLRRKYGEKPALKEFGKAKTPWWAQATSQASLLQRCSYALRSAHGQLAHGLFDKPAQPSANAELSTVVMGAVEGGLDALEERALWQKHAVSLS